MSESSGRTSSSAHSARLPERDRPWMMRTYAGHSDARRSNELYRRNLEKGQTGLSVAFDLPTQTGYDPDHELARGEVGKVGVSIAHRGDMHTLLDGIPLDQMNTSMTINATAAWLLALYIVAAEEQGVEQEKLQGTTQNDILKEYLSRGTYAFPPGPSMRLIADTITYTVQHIPKWNPINICSYHLQEAGATPVQEIAYALSNGIAVLDAVRERLEAGGQADVGDLMGQRVRPDLLLCQRRRPVRRGARQAPSDGRAVGRVGPRALRGGRREAATFPLRSAGQLTRADRGSAGEQCLSDCPGGAGRDARPERPGPGDSAPGLERGSRAAPALGSAMVAAPPADPGLRDRPARVPGHLRGVKGDGWSGGRPRRRGPRGDAPGGRAWAARWRPWTT